MTDADRARWAYAALEAIRRQLREFHPPPGSPEADLKAQLSARVAAGLCGHRYDKRQAKARAKRAGRVVVVDAGALEQVRCWPAPQLPPPTR